MRKKYYLPTRELERVLWLSNFAQKLASHAATLSLSAADVADTQADAAFYAFIINYLESLKTDLSELVAFKNEVANGLIDGLTGSMPTIDGPPGSPPAVVPDGIFARVKRLVRLIKAKKAYSNSIGQDLGIIGADDGFNPDAYESSIALAVFNNAVRIVFLKGRVDAVVMYSRLKGDTEWEEVGVAINSPFYDTRPLANPSKPEVREYMAKGRIGNEEVGLESAMRSIVFAG
jgi:hypothetical protein